MVKHECKVPDEVCAVAAEGGLFEEAGCELMVFHFYNPLVLECSFPLEDWKSGGRREGRGQRRRGGRGRRRGQGQWRKRRRWRDWCRHAAVGRMGQGKRKEVKKGKENGKMKICRWRIRRKD